MRNRILHLFSLILVLSLFLTACSTNSNISNNNSEEEICLAIETNSLRNICLSYVKEDSSFCKNDGCFLLAHKLHNETICTLKGLDKTQYWSSSDTGSKTVKKVTNEFCQHFAGLTDNNIEQYRSSEPELIRQNPNWPVETEEIVVQKSEILSKSVNDLCDLDKKECYGSCKVEMANCAMIVAQIKKDSEICKEVKKIGVAWWGDCYKNLAESDVRACNYAKGYDRDECYLDFITKKTYSIYVLSYETAGMKNISE